MNKKNLLLVIGLIIGVVITIHHVRQTIIFNQRVESLKDYPYLFGNMSWSHLKQNLTKGYYCEVDPYMINNWGYVCNVTNYEIYEVFWEHIISDAISGHRIYYDNNEHRIWMFWSTSVEGGLLITVYSPTNLFRYIEFFKYIIQALLSRGLL